MALNAPPSPQILTELETGLILVCYILCQIHYKNPTAVSRWEF